MDPMADWAASKLAEFCPLSETTSKTTAANEQQLATFSSF